MDLATRVNRIDEHLVELSGALAQLAAAQARTEERMADLAAAQRDLAAAQARTEERVAELAQAQARTEERVGELAQAQARAEAQIERLAEAQVQTEQQLGALRAWQTGESRRREGEQYERQVVRRAATIFGGGDGGSPEDAAIRRRIMAALDRIPGETFRRAISPRGKFDELPAENDPFLADLVWWKGEHVAVAEVSIVVDNNDVFRAQARADTLRRAGSDALPVVIGQSWSDLGSLGLAQQLRVAYWVDRDLSDSFIEFRQLENGPPA